MKICSQHILLLFSLLFLSGLGFSSCQKEDENGDLYGMWQLLDKSKTTPDGSFVTENQKQKQIYWCFQLHLMSIKSAAYTNEILGKDLLAHFKKAGDSIYLYDFYHNIRFNDTLLSDKDIPFLEPAGICRKNPRFKIEHLSSKSMTLKSEDCRLTFRKF